MIMVLRHSLRSVRRALKAGDLTVLLLALCIGVGSMSAVGLATDRVSQAVERRASESLAADLVVRSRDTLPDDYEQQARAAGLRTAGTLEFPSMISAGEQSRLAQIQGVTPAYPLRGRLRVAPEPFAAGEPVGAIPEPGTVWLESRLFATLEIQPGDEVSIGRARLTARRVLEHRPDQGFEFVDIAPAALMNIEDIEATGLLGPASRVSYRLLVAGERDALTQFRETLEPALQPGERIRGIRDGQGRLTRSLERADRFLGLAALVAVLLSAVAIAMATRRYCARETDSVAVLKCLGLSRARVTVLHGLNLLWTGLAGCAAGVLLGYATQAGLVGLLGEWLPVDLPGPAVMPAAAAACMGMLVLAGVGVPPVLQLGRTPPLRVLRREVTAPPPSALLVATLALGALVALLLWRTGDLVLSAYVLGGAAGGALLLSLGAWLLVRGLQPLRANAGTAVRFGLANIARRGPESIAQIVAFGVGLLALLLLMVIRGDLLEAWRASVPEDAPNHFLINIQPDEREGVREFFAQRGLGQPELFPMVRARLVRINGEPAAEHSFPEPDEGRWFVERQQNLSWASELPAGNTVTAGRFRGGTPEGDGLPPVSLDQDVAGDLGVGVGDTLSFDVAGETIQSEITSLRRIRWDSFHPNFFVLFTPGVLESYPANWMTSLHIPRERTSELMELVRRYPSVTVIDVGSILRQIRRVMDQAVVAVEYVFAFTLAAGIVVLLAAVQASREARRFESALLRTFGATRGKVFAAVAAEFAVVGMLAGLLASAGATITSWLLATRVFELDWQMNYLLWPASVLGGAVLVGITGLLATRRVVGQSPLLVLNRQ